MRLFLHQFRKDFRQTWIVWALWFFFVLVQFGLAAWTVNPADLVGSGLYGQIVGMVPSFHALIVFILIPLLVFQEPPVGTTATWLTRPLPPGTILGSKLAAIAILVALPLLGQCAVLASHHVIPRDVALAGFQIALTEASWISLAIGLAVLCPNFGVFLVAAAGLYVIQYFSGWIWNWLAFLHLDVMSRPGRPSPFLGQSRVIAADLLRIGFGLGVAVFQYLTRRTRAALVLGVCGLVAGDLALRYWPWDFVALAAPPAAAAPAPFDASALHIHPGGNHNLNDRPDPKGGPNLRTLFVDFLADGLPPENDLMLQSLGGEQTYPDGSKLELHPYDFLANGNPNLDLDLVRTGPFYGGGESSVTAIDAAIGNLPILNQGFSGNASYYIQDLFSLDAATFAKKGADLGSAVFRLRGQVGGYRETAEIPLRKGAFFAQGSRRTTLTEIVPGANGVELALRERSVGLLFDPALGRDGEAPPIYLLVNRKRGEALRTQNGNNFSYFGRVYAGNGGAGGPLAALDLGDHGFEQFNTVRLTARSQQGDDRVLPIAVDDAWISEAVLVRLEPVPRGEFTATVKLPDFALDGHALPNWDESRTEGPDLAALAKIVLPEHPSRADAWTYIVRILSLTAHQRNSGENDPQVDMLAKVGPEHAVDLLIAATFQDYYPRLALKQLDLTGQPDAKKMLFRLLPDHNDLLELVGRNHWEADARPFLMTRLAKRRPGENIDDRWLDALALFHDDPEVKQALLDLLPSQQNVIRIVIANHWEADAKPILINAISRSKPGSQIDERWFRVLDSFQDDSRVKALVLRSLPSNQNEIQTVVANHWEADALPVLLEALDNAKPGDRLDDRCFRLFAGFPDRADVKAAVLRVLPFSHNAIEAVVLAHWEDDAEPVILDAFSRVKPGEFFDDKWFQALAPVSDRPEVKAAVLAVLPFSQNASILVLRNHWEAEAAPTVLDLLDKAKPGAQFDGRWFQILAAAPDQDRVKKAILRILPFVLNASDLVIRNHWEDDARPLVVAALAKAKPTDRFDNAYVGIAAGAPDAPGVKEAVLHVFPANDAVIDFVLRNHWERDAEPVLLRKVASALLGQYVDRKWIQALASLRDPATYPILLSYAGQRMNGGHDYGTLDDIRPLPAAGPSALMRRDWETILGTDRERFAYLPAASWGIAEALDRDAAILVEPRETDKQKATDQQWRKTAARETLNAATPCPDRLLDADLAAWFQANKAALAFDPGLGMFLFHPKPLPPDEPWLGGKETMRQLGRRLAAGDTAALDEIDAALARATDGLDPKRDAEKIQTVRRTLAANAFGVLDADALQTPAGFALLEAATRKPALRPAALAAYSRAAEGGNGPALDALLAYAAHSWTLFEVVESLGGTVRKGNPKAIAFEAALPANPDCTLPVLNQATPQLRDAANAGYAPAVPAYQAVQKARAALKPTD